MSGSLILRVSAPLILWVAFAVSIFILLRGHNAPGGGFLGGLIAAAGVLLFAIARGRAAAQCVLRVPAVTMCGIGLLAATASGLLGFLTPEASYLTHRWWMPDDGIALGTTIVFDLGVHLVVLGTVSAMFLPLLPED